MFMTENTKEYIIWTTQGQKNHQHYGVTENNWIQLIIYSIIYHWSPLPAKLHSRFLGYIIEPKKQFVLMWGLNSSII